MKKYSKFLMILGFGVFALTSCNLDEFPAGSISYQEGEDMITSIGDLKKLQNGMYQSYRLTHYGQLSEAGEFMCDGFNATRAYGNNYGAIHRTDPSFTSGNYDTRDFWAINYFAIKNYNLFIQHIVNFEPENDSEAKVAKVAEGEAHFFRAVAYLQLVRHYGKLWEPSSPGDLAVPLILKYDQEEKPARATVHDVYNQIKADLDIAAEKLAGVAGKVGSPTPTIDAVNAVYARYYLDIREWQKAAEYAEKVINSTAGYALSDDAEAMEKEYINDKGKEPIMQLPATLAESGASTPFDNVTNEIRNISYTYATKTDEDGLYFAPYYIPSQKLINLYEANDLRLKQWFDKTVKVKIDGAIFQNQFYIFTKYLGNPELRSNDIPNARQKVKPFLIGEMYLIAAEAYWNHRNLDKSKEMLNALQTKRGATASEATPVNIKNEWFKETVGEGLRVSCLKRWKDGFEGRQSQPGAADAVMSGSEYAQKVLPSTSNFWVWPIPNYEIQINHNLEQNPGY